MADLRDHGHLSLALNLRRLSDAIFDGVDEICRERGAPLSSRCFAILFALRDHGLLGISEIADRLGQSHSAVSQMSRKLLVHGLAREWPDPRDRRRRLLALSRRGAALMRRLAPTWTAVDAAMAQLDRSHPLSATLADLDDALEARGFAQRVRAARLAAEAAAVEIIPFERRYRADFRRLNVEWLERHLQIEPIDEQVLADPQGLVDAGGQLFLARLRGTIVGTCALLAVRPGVMELSKLAVTETCQRLGIGRRLLAAALAHYQSLDGQRLYLETNSVLRPAIALCESVGFRRVTRPGGPSAYPRADVYMLWRAPRSRRPSGPTRRKRPARSL